MVRKFLVGLPIMVAILATGVGVALSKHEEKAVSGADLSGWWSLDASKSDAPRAMGEGWGGGREGRRGGGFGGHHGGGGSRPARLPERFRIRQDADMLTIADSTRAPGEEIVIGHKVEQPPEGMGDANVVPKFAGAWNKGKLEIVRSGPRGSMKQSFALEEDGKELVIRSSLPARESRPARDIKRVYRRTST